MKKLYAFITSIITASLLLMPVAGVHAAAPNLIANPSAELSAGGQPTGWQSDTWGTQTSAFTYVTTAGHTGTDSLDVKATAFTNGDSKWFFTPVAVNPNTVYAFSDYYKSSIYTDVLVRFTNTQGAFSYKWIGGAAASNTNWKLFSTTFTAPADVAQLTVLHLLAGVGHLQTDDYSLTDGTPVPPTPAPAGQNIVPNNSVETVSATNNKLPAGGWKTNNPKNNSVNFTYPTNGHTGSRSIKIAMNSYTAGDAYWSYPEQPVVGGVLYEFADWYKSSVDTNVYAQITLKDGSQQWIYVGTAWHSPAWNHFDQQFTMPANAASATVYHSIFAVGSLQTDDYSLVQYAPQGFSRGIVSMTFDDGIESTYAGALPILQKYGAQATFYIITGVINNDPYYMTTPQLTALKNAGNEIGAHTVTHPELINLTNTQINTELKQSKNSLTSWLGAAPTDFATPHGEYNSNVLTYAKKYYSSHRSVDVGFNSRENFDIYNIKVQNVLVTTPVQQVIDWVNQAVAQHTWLVLVYHAVDPSDSIPDSQWNTHPADLDAEVSAIKNSGAALLPVNAALNEIRPQL